MALKIDTKLPTPDGWTRVNEVGVGAFLFDELGYPCRVLSVSRPYVVDQAYSMEFGWGKKKYPESEYICSPDQRFYSIGYRTMQKLSNPSERRDYTNQEKLNTVPPDWPTWKLGKQANPIASVSTAEEIGNTLKYARKHGSRGTQYYYNHTIPITFSLKLGPNNPYKLHPYVAGVCLNYWDFDKNVLKITLEWYPYFRQLFMEYDGIDLQVLTKLKDRTPRSAHIECTSDDLADHIHRSRIFRKREIPTQYLRTSEKDRLDLLAGLTDKVLFQYSVVHRERASINYTHNSEVLVAGTAELLRSLGLPAYYLKLKEDKNLQHVIEWHPVVPPQSHPKYQIRHFKDTLRDGNDFERYVWKTYSSDIINEETMVRNIVVDSPHGLYSAGELFLPVLSDTREM